MARVRARCAVFTLAGLSCNGMGDGTSAPAPAPHLQRIAVYLLLLFLSGLGYGTIRKLGMIGTLANSSWVAALYRRSPSDDTPDYAAGDTVAATPEAAKAPEAAEAEGEVASPHVAVPVDGTTKKAWLRPVVQPCKYSATAGAQLTPLPGMAGGTNMRNRINEMAVRQSSSGQQEARPARLTCQPSVAAEPIGFLNEMQHVRRALLAPTALQSDDESNRNREVS